MCWAAAMQSLVSLLSNKEIITFMVNDVKSSDTIFIVKSCSFTFSTCLNHVSMHNPNSHFNALASKMV